MKNANSRHHYTKTELFDMTQQLDETSGKFKDIVAPSDLSRKQKGEFYDYAYKLLDYGMSELDEWALAAFIRSKDLYLYYMDEMKKTVKAKPINKWQAIAAIDDEDLRELITKIVEKQRSADLLKDYQNLADKQFKQCISCAAALGLTISSRAKLLIPKSDQNVDL